MNDFQTDIASINTLQNGLHLNVRPSQAKHHPVQDIFQNDYITDESVHHKIEAGLFGLGYTMEKNMEINMLSQIRRPPMFQSSFALLNGLTGRDEDIDVEDYLGAPMMTVNHNCDVHQIMDEFYGF